MSATKIRHTSSELISMMGLVVGCVLFGLGSLIVAHVDGVGAYAMAFWRLLISVGIFATLAIIFRQKLPSSRRAIVFALVSGAALGLDLALWHESIYAVGPGISTLPRHCVLFSILKRIVLEMMGPDGPKPVDCTSIKDGLTTLDSRHDPDQATAY